MLRVHRYFPRGHFYLIKGMLLEVKWLTGSLGNGSLIVLPSQCSKSDKVSHQLGYSTNYFKTLKIIETLL